MGLLSTVLQTLSMRDAMTARHSAAVARYSREVAVMLGLDEREQDLIHTAALLHDIGKFILPDSVLFANRKLTDDEWELIKLHPEQGAKLVERIEGYGPVAEIVLHHHERYAGGGYPAGIAGEEIPLGARILSVADTYDVMTSRDSYRRPVSSEAALAELRRVAGTQLDPKVVEVFERMILESGVAFSHADEADFEYELAFERRVSTRTLSAARPRSGPTECASLDIARSEVNAATPRRPSCASRVTPLAAPSVSTPSKSTPHHRHEDATRSPPLCALGLSVGRRLGGGSTQRRRAKAGQKPPRAGSASCTTCRAAGRNGRPPAAARPGRVGPRRAPWRRPRGRARPGTA